MRKFLIFFLSIVMVFSITACSSPENDIDSTAISDGSGDETVSVGQYFKDTENAVQTCYMGRLGGGEETELPDNPLVVLSNPGFRFECHGFDSNQTLYVFVDGDIDDVAGEFDLGGIDKNYYNGEIMLDGSQLNEGEHTVQFVQFDGKDVIYCVTRHYEVSLTE